MNIIKNDKIRKPMLWIGSAVLVFISIGFAHKEREGKVCGEVIVRITNQYDNYFIEKEEILDIITHDGNLELVGNYVDNLNLKTLEKDLKDEKFIKDAQVYKDLKGNIIVTAEQRRPVARIVRPRAPDAYIDEQGEVLPVSEKFTSRVLLITGEFTSQWVDAERLEGNDPYMELILRINEDSFWRAQISQLDIDGGGEILIYPEVSKQVVEFGKPMDVDIKLQKLKTFYSKILPFKGWNSYKRVNLKYKNQIICE